MKEAEKLAKAVREYLAEVDNVAPDYLYRQTLRRFLREALKEYDEASKDAE